MKSGEEDAVTDLSNSDVVTKYKAAAQIANQVRWAGWSRAGRAPARLLPPARPLSACAPRVAPAWRVSSATPPGQARAWSPCPHCKPL